MGGVHHLGTEKSAEICCNKKKKTDSSCKEKKNILLRPYTVCYVSMLSRHCEREFKITPLIC